MFHLSKTRHDAILLHILLFLPIALLLIANDTRDWCNISEYVQGFRFIGLDKSNYVFLPYDLTSEPVEHHIFRKVVLETRKNTISQSEIIFRE